MTDKQLQLKPIAELETLVKSNYNYVYTFFEPKNKEDLDRCKAEMDVYNKNKKSLLDDRLVTLNSAGQKAIDTIIFGVDSDILKAIDDFNNMVF
jgi:hypothetical protein